MTLTHDIAESDIVGQSKLIAILNELAIPETNERKSKRSIRNEEEEEEDEINSMVTRKIISGVTLVKLLL